ASTPGCRPASIRRPCSRACAWTRRPPPTGCASYCGTAPAGRGWPATSPGTRCSPSWGIDPSYNRRMRLLLQQRPGGPEAPRFVQLMLERDLLGGWTLVRETGQVGGRSSVRREQYLDQRDAFKALEHARDLQLKKGFQLMFAQGVDAPK